MIYFQPAEGRGRPREGVPEGVPQAIRFRVLGGIAPQYSLKSDIHKNREN